ncbi:hypothetical protein HA402_002996 [Bradysia odoriphaga]|nr:hypothetical protein HA402_002996 [Bradysia odoriphaga]
MTSSDDTFDMSDDVFEEPDTHNVGKRALNVGEFYDQRTASPTGYPGFKPPKEALRMYALENDGGEENHTDGWKSYKIEDGDFDETVVHKTILLGDSGVGKTSFLVQYNTGEFRAGSFSATVGIALTNKIVSLDSTRVKLQIWDTAGQERFRSVTHAYYRDAHALLLLYDVTNKVSFDNIRAWLGEIREYAQEDVVIMLLGNKADCPEREVRKEDGERLAREYNVSFLETSAKNGLNVELAFLTVAKKLKSRKNDIIDESRFNVHEYVKEHTQRPSCPPCNL